MMNIDNVFTPGDALLVVGVQNDFCPGGALPIEDGDAVAPILNRWIAAAEARNIPVYASRDWHPAGHVSFKESGGPCAFRIALAPVSILNCGSPIP